MENIRRSPVEVGSFKKSDAGFLPISAINSIPWWTWNTSSFMVDFPFTMIVFGWVILLVTSVRMICKCPLIHDSAKKHVSWQLPPTAASVAAAAHIASFFFELWTWGEKRWSCSTHSRSTCFFCSALQTSSRRRCCLAFLAQIKSIIGKYNFPTEQNPEKSEKFCFWITGGGNFSRSKSTWQNKKVPNAKGLTFSRLHVLPTLLNSKGQKGS